MLSLFPDEQIITQSNGGVVTLTTHRICYESREWGRSYNQNIMLEHITSSENYSTSQIWLLVIAGLLAVFGVGGGNGRNAGPVLIAALILCGIYVVTRRNFIIVSSPSTKMKIPVIGMKRETVLEFINKIEQAKNTRLNSLNNRPSIPLQPMGY